MSVQPKVAYVVKRYPRFSETFIVNEILAHEAAGLPVEIFALRPVEETHFQDILARVQTPVTRVPEKLRNAEALWMLMREAQDALPGCWTVLGRMREMDAGNVAQAVLLAMACRRKGIQHIHAHFGTTATSVGRLAADLCGISYSFTAHAKDIFHEYDEPQHLDLKLRDASQVVTVSDWNVAYLRDRFGPLADRVVRIYNGLDLDRFAYEPPAPDAEGILAVGRLVEKKGLHILVEAVRILRASGRDVTCRILGGGPEAANLAAQVMGSGLTGIVRFHGPQPQAEVVRAMRTAAVFACPCIVGGAGDRDGLPTVLLEATALGTPVVASDVTGIPELVRDGETGLCVPEGDPEALAAALARMLDDQGLRRRMSEAARALIEREFDGHANAARLRQVFAEAVAAQARPLKGVA
jgi:colanic acid/amylovoran biosynthesis glycosyltransferase